MSAAPRAPSARCLFCGGVLARTRRRGRLAPPKSAGLACRRCRAVFVVTRNARGCLVRLAVEDCGAGAACCQRSRRA